jgi:hypothetical protein
MANHHLMEIHVRGKPLIVVTEHGDIYSAEGYTAEEATAKFLEVMLLIHKLEFGATTPLN